VNSLLKGQPSGRFLGVNLRQDRVSLADEDMAKAINADFHSQPGVIVLRHGRTQHNTDVLADLEIRRLAKINGHRYQVAGTHLYCDYTVNTGVSFLSTNVITTMMPFRPLHDATTWNFVASNNIMYKVDCLTRGFWGSGIPSVPTVKVGTSTGFSGTFVATYTKVRLDSALTTPIFESNPYTPYVSITVSNQSITIGDMEDPTDSDPTSNALGIYRSFPSQDVPLLVDYYAIPSESAVSVTHVFEVDPQANLIFHWSVNLGTVSFTGGSVVARGTQSWEPTGSGDSADAAGRRGTHLWEISLLYVTTQTKFWAKYLSASDPELGAIVEVDNSVATTAEWAVQFQEHAFLTRNADNPHHLYFSKRFRPEQFPAENYIEIGNPDDPLQCALPIAGMLGVFARRTKYRVVGNAVTGFVAAEAASPRGTPCPAAAITSERGITFVARDGIFNTFLASPDQGFAEKILPLFFGETVNDMAYINWEAAETFSAAMYKNRYYLSYAETGSDTPNRLAVYSWDTGNWYHYDHPMRSLYVEEDTDYFMGGGVDGYVSLLENGSTDAGSSIALDVETKDFRGDSIDIRKLFQHLKLNTNTGGATVTVKFYVDDTLEHTTTVSTSTRQETLLPLPENIMGHSWRVKFTYTGSTRIRLYSCAALFLPLNVV
jgi:hypothetical protein